MGAGTGRAVSLAPQVLQRADVLAEAGAEPGDEPEAGSSIDGELQRQ